MGFLSGMGAGMALLILLPLAVVCFFGYRIFRILIAAFGFAIGAAAGGVLGYIMMREIGAILVGLLLGLLLGWLAHKLYKLGVFVLCFGAGAMLGAALGLMAGSPSTVLAFAGIAGIALGVLGVILTKPIIITATALGGGMGGGMMLGAALGGLPMGITFGILLSVGGIFVQFYLDKKKPKSAEGTADEVPGQGQKRSFHLPSLPKGDGEGGGVNDFLSSLKSGVAGLGQKVGTGVQSVVNSQAVRQLRGVIDNTKTERSLPGWNELIREDAALWSPGLPIVVNALRVVAPAGGAGEEVRLALGFQNLSGQDILGVFFSVDCFDLLKQKLGGLEKLTVQDFRLTPGGLWFSEQPFALPDKDTRRVELTVKNVVFADGSIWSNEDGTALAPLDAQGPLELPAELAEELFLACREQTAAYDPAKIFHYQPRREADHWWCACGQMNLGETCVACGMGRDALFELAQPQALAQRREARLAEQARMEEERRQKIAEQTEAAKQKAAQLSQAAKDKAAAAGVKTKDTVRKGLDKTTALGKETGDKLKRFWQEKIVANRRPILIVLAVFLAVLVVLLGTLFGLRALRAGREQASVPDPLPSATVTVPATPSPAPTEEPDTVSEEDIAAALRNREIAQTAQAMLDKLEEETSPLQNSNFSAPVPLHGAYYWTGRSYAEQAGEDRVTLYWNVDQPVRSSAQPDPRVGCLLGAKTLDMDRDGMPELLLFRLTPGHEEQYFMDQALVAELWMGDGAGGLTMTHQVSLTPEFATDAPDMYRLSLVSGGAGEYWKVVHGAWTGFYAPDREQALQLFHLEEGFFPDNEMQMDPDYYLYYIGDREVTQGEYDAAMAEWSQNEVFLGSNYMWQQLSEEDYSALYSGLDPWPEGGVGALAVDLPAETQAARSALTALAAQ